MIYTLPVPKGPFWDLTVTLDGTDYLLTGQYNQRANRYYLSIAQPDGTPIASSKAVTCGWPMFLNSSNIDLLPPGRIMAVSQTNDRSDPGLGELGPGLRVELFYFDAAEIAASKVPT